MTYHYMTLDIQHTCNLRNNVRRKRLKPTRKEAKKETTKDVKRLDVRLLWDDWKWSFPGSTWTRRSVAQLESDKRSGSVWLLGLSTLFQSLLCSDQHCLCRRKLSEDLCKIRVANCSLWAFLLCHRNSFGEDVKKKHITAQSWHS